MANASTAPAAATLTGQVRHVLIGDARMTVTARELVWTDNVCVFRDTEMTAMSRHAFTTAAVMAHVTRLQHCARVAEAGRPRTAPNACVQMTAQDEACVQTARVAATMAIKESHVTSSRVPGTARVTESATPHQDSARVR